LRPEQSLDAQLLLELEIPRISFLILTEDECVELTRQDETNASRCVTIRMACLVRVPKIMHDEVRRKEFERR